MNLATIEHSPLFTQWRDPVSGVRSFILTQRIAPIQQSFYFTNSSITADGRFVWFYVAFPPAGDAYYGRQLGVVDLAEQQIRYFPETTFMDASPFVDDSGVIYWTTGLEVWKRSPHSEESPERVGVFPAELARNRRPLRLATHLSRSADGKSFALDAQIGNEWFVGDLPIDGSPFHLWQTFDRCYNHTQFSPIDPDLLLTAQDSWCDPASGATGGIDDRLWLIRHGEKARPVFPEAPSPLRGHEWWDTDGAHLWYVHYHCGTEKVNIFTGEKTLVYRGEPIHSHSSQDGKYIASDFALSAETWKVAFYNARTEREINVVSMLPPLALPRRHYHVHPHPRFCFDDRFIVYTTNVLGRVDIAFAPVAELVAATSP